MLSRKIVEQGIYPAVGRWHPPPAFWEADIVGEHYRVATGAVHSAALSRNCRTSSPFWAWTAGRERQTHRCPRPQAAKFLSQPFAVAENLPA